MIRIGAALLGLCLAATAALGQHQNSFSGSAVPIIPVITIPPGNANVIGSLRAANFNTTADQAIAIRSTITAWLTTSIIVTNCVGPSFSAVGGIYPLANKGGTPLVAASQTYVVGSNNFLTLTFNGSTAVNRYTSSAVYLSLTTPQGSAVTCDVYLLGVDLT
jgi:hypothetical protein